MAGGLVTVIVPVYNTEQYLERCVNSILDQSYTNMEIILVDDGSTDNSVEICDSYSKKIEFIKVIHTENHGLSAARNVGLRLASGEFVSFIDSDDFIEKDMFDSMLEKMDSDVDFVSCGFRKVYPDGKQKKIFTPSCDLRYLNEEIVKALLVTDYLCFSMCNKLFRRRILEGIRFPEGKLHEDIPVMYKIAKRSRGTVCLAQAKYNCYLRENSLSRGNYKSGNLYFVVFMERIYKDVKIYFPQYADIALKRYLWNVIILIDMIENGDNEDDHKADLQRLQKLLRSMILPILKNPFFNKEERRQILKAGWEHTVLFKLKEVVLG